MSVRCKILPYTCLQILALNKWPVFHKKLKMEVTYSRWIPWTKILQSTRLPVPHPMWRCCDSTRLCESLKWILRCDMNFEVWVGSWQEILMWLLLLHANWLTLKPIFCALKLHWNLHYITHAHPHKTQHWSCFQVCFIRFVQRVLHNIVNFNFLFLAPVLTCSLCGLFNMLDINRSFTLECWERKHFFLSVCGTCTQLKWQVTFRPVVCGKQKVWKACEYRSIVACVCSTRLHVFLQIPHLSYYIVIGAE